MHSPDGMLWSEPRPVFERGQCLWRVQVCDGILYAAVILTFLGVGVDKEPSWGQMIADAKSELMQGIWWPLAAAGIMLFLLTLSVNYVGDALRDALDPKLRGKD